MRVLTKNIVLVCICALSATVSYAEGSSASHSLFERECETASFFGDSYSTPVSRRFLSLVSLSGIGTSFRSDTYIREVDQTLGRGGYRWGIGAETYMRLENSTVWGHASYSHGKTRSLSGIENSDPGIVYPYFTADAIGGNMSEEHYRFGGGYSGNISRQLLWGASLSYDAGQYYRNVDPRPKNITGDLKIDASIGYRILGHTLSATFDFGKYRQSNDIKFVSEMGEAKIYHTTGLGTHYARFAGNGLSALYDGISLGGSLSLVPEREKGLVASVAVANFRFNKKLKDLNKMELAKADENSLTFEAGWKGTAREGRQSYAVKLTGNALKRTGKENLFGDPQANIYPQIGTVTRFHRNEYSFALTGLWQVSSAARRKYFRVEPAIGYSHFHENYMEPVRLHTLNSLAASVKVSGAFPLFSKVTCYAGADASFRKPMKTMLYVDTERLADDERLTDAFLNDVRYMDGDQYVLRGRMDFVIPVAGKYALQIGGDYAHEFYVESAHCNRWSAHAAFIF